MHSANANDSNLLFLLANRALQSTNQSMMREPNLHRSFTSTGMTTSSNNVPSTINRSSMRDHANRFESFVSPQHITGQRSAQALTTQPNLGNGTNLHSSLQQRERSTHHPLPPHQTQRFSGSILYENTQRQIQLSSMFSQITAPLGATIFERLTLLPLQTRPVDVISRQIHTQMHATQSSIPRDNRSNPTATHMAYASRHADDINDILARYIENALINSPVFTYENPSALTRMDPNNLVAQVALQARNASVPPCQAVSNFPSQRQVSIPTANMLPNGGTLLSSQAILILVMHLLALQYPNDD